MTPELLLNVEVLDLVEISGNQARAARALAMAQSTVSRSCQALVDQLQLNPARGDDQLFRWGSSGTLHHLRLASRAHRLQHGHLRLATDALHQPLLEKLPGVLAVPPRFHSGSAWRTLLQEGVVDGVLVSSFCELDTRDRRGWQRWRGHRLLRLGTLELRAALPALEHPASSDGPGHARQVLVPRRDCWPGVHRLLVTAGVQPVRAPHQCQGMADWLRLSRGRGLPLLVAPGIAAPRLWEGLGLRPCPELALPDLREELWLVLADDTALLERSVQRSLRAITRRVHRASAAWLPRDDS